MFTRRELLDSAEYHINNIENETWRFFKDKEDPTDAMLEAHSITRKQFNKAKCGADVKVHILLRALSIYGYSIDVKFKETKDWV